MTCAPKRSRSCPFRGKYSCRVFEASRNSLVDARNLSVLMSSVGRSAASMGLHVAMVTSHNKSARRQVAARSWSSVTDSSGGPQISIRGAVEKQSANHVLRTKWARRAAVVFERFTRIVNTRRISENNEQVVPYSETPAGMYIA